ncbi:MAG TPA: nicotinamidase [Nitrosomonas halophila]|nr:nicotinamidase [Nitrosomonas halophila]
MEPVTLEHDDALIIADMQHDFLPGGSLAVPEGDAIIPLLNQYIARFEAGNLPVFATRDWHPANHCSFVQQGGIWPPHCIAHTPGADFHPALNWPPGTHVISKATAQEKEAYSGFEDTALDSLLRAHGVRRLFIAGIATEYCILQTVKDALRKGYRVFVLEDGVRAINLQPDDGAQAIQEMRQSGAHLIDYGRLQP